MPYDRRCVLLVMYDLPVKTAAQRKAAAVFRKYLISDGFQPVQESVYVKLMRNETGSNADMEAIKNAAPGDGAVNAIVISLSVFLSMRSLRGEAFEKERFAGDMVMI